MRPAFIIINTMVAALLFGFWRLGLLSGFTSLSGNEVVLLGLLTLYSVPGFVSVVRGNFTHARFVANSIPMWGLAFTVLGMIMAVSQFKSLTPEVIGEVFKNLAFAITPNMVGVVLMAWIRELCFYIGGEEI